VKVEDSPMPLSRAKRGSGAKRVKASNVSLPPGVHEGGLWRKSVITTLFRWVAGQDDPWAIADDDLILGLRTICEAFYGNLEDFDLEITNSSPAFHVVSHMYNR
jgi:hypothetical protein